MEALLLPWIIAGRQPKVETKVAVIPRKRKAEPEYENEVAVIPRKIFHVAPQFRLIFFDARGPVEISRMVFTFAGIPFDDVRLKTETECKKAMQGE